MAHVNLMSIVRCEGRKRSQSSKLFTTIIAGRSYCVSVSRSPNSIEGSGKRSMKGGEAVGCGKCLKCRARFWIAYLDLF